MGFWEKKPEAFPNFFHKVWFTKTLRPRTANKPVALPQKVLIENKPTTTTTTRLPEATKPTQEFPKNNLAIKLSHRRSESQKTELSAGLLRCRPTLIPGYTVQEAL